MISFYNETMMTHAPLLVERHPPAVRSAQPDPVFNPESTSVFPYELILQGTLQRINRQLACYLTLTPALAKEHEPHAAGLWEAMRYGTLDGGKRIRAVLAIEACKACGGEIEQVLPTACAIEMVHAQSLMHDDLPCMDDDDLRRGKPSAHKAFGESTAVLAGDALIAMAFGVIARETPRHRSDVSEVILTVLQDFSDATSIQGLVNGQYVDIQSEGQPYTADTLRYIHTYKTGALFRFAFLAGARLAGASEETVQAFGRMGQKLGLAFQIVDDLLDIDASSEVLGKTAGKDQVQQKATYPALYGVEASRLQVAELAQEAIALLHQQIGVPAGGQKSLLEELIGFVAHRLS